MLTDITSADRTVLEIEDGSVAIAGRPILRHINLCVEQGEFVALMGANGSGKSTLVRAMTGLRRVSGGEVRMFGTDLAHFKDWHRIGFVPQRSTVGGGVPVSVWEMVASGRLTRRGLLRPLFPKDRKAIADALEVVGLSERSKDGITTLSGGQQQRVLIARALAGEPELFFLDEPNAGVDLPNQRALARALEILKERGSTVILVAHELGPMARLVDRAIVMRDGRIAYDGEPLADHEVHGLFFGTGHDPHQHDARVRDHTPHLVSPLDLVPDEEVR